MPDDTDSDDDTLKHERALNTSQAGELLGVANITLAQWRQRGQGPAFFRVAKRQVRYRLADVLEEPPSATPQREPASARRRSAL